MNNSILLFDFDGTIADTYLYMCEISNRICGEFGYSRIQPSDVAFLKAKTSKEVIRYLKVPMLKIPAIVARAKREYQKDVGSIKIVDGLKDSLKNLKSRGVRMGVVSSNSRENVLQVLKTHGLDIFEFIHSTSRIWGKNIALQSLIRQHQLSTAEVVYIGDEVRDIVAAKRLGIKVAAVTWGYNSRDVLVAHQPDFLLEKPQDLLKIV